MITVLLVTRDERWRARITAALPEASVFLASNDAEAMAQFGRIEIDIVVWANTSSPAGAPSFLGRVRELMPTSVTVFIGADEDGEMPADFALAETCTPRQMQAVVWKALERHRLLQENALLRARVPAPPVASAFAGENPAPAS